MMMDDEKIDSIAVGYVANFYRQYIKEVTDLKKTEEPDLKRIAELESIIGSMGGSLKRRLTEKQKKSMFDDLENALQTAKTEKNSLEIGEYTEIIARYKVDVYGPEDS